MIQEYTGMICHPHKAVVGANAFQHESGIHQDGMIKNKSTYEIMTPESIGLNRGDSQSGVGIVLGKHSGRNAVSTRLKELGYEFEPDKLNAVFARFKEIAENKKGGIVDEDLEALVSDQSGFVYSLWEVTGLEVATSMSGIPTATVTMKGPDSIERYVAATGTGQDLLTPFIKPLIKLWEFVHLDTYAMQSVNEGIEALAITRVTIEPCDSEKGAVQTSTIRAQSGMKKRKFSGTGSDTDVVVSSAGAHTSASINFSQKHQKSPTR